VRAAELVVRCLENEGVSLVFGLPGEETISLMDALSASAIRFVLARHEQAAAFMADLYGRVTGHAGVCLSTLGPGATNLVTGIADAYLDRVPLVALTAQQELAGMHKESHQYIDIPQLLRPITKWNARIESADVVPEVVRKAFKTAQLEKPGSTHIELPADVADASTEARTLASDRPRRPSPDRPSLDAAAELLDRAERPMILAGNGVIRGRASEALTRLSEGFAIPVVQTPMSLGAVPWDSPMSLFTVGLHSSDYEAVGFDSADLVVAVGYDLVEYDPHAWNPNGDRRIVHIDFTPAEVSSDYVAEVEVAADIRETLNLLRDRMSRHRNPARARALREGLLERRRRWLEAPASGRGIRPPAALDALRDAMALDDVLVSDIGAHKIWIGRFFRAARPNTVIVPNGLSPMGIALPGGIGVKLAEPDRHVVTVSGDGGFAMNLQELETARRERAPTVNVVFRDNGLGSIRWKHSAHSGRAYGVEFENPDLVRLAEAFGVRGYRAERAQDLGSIVAEAIGLGVPSVVDVPIDYSENPFLRPASGAGSPK
jgi:acetolactate synthase-1/2/3 large subunit